MKLNKEDFLNSELGSNLLECIESWDWALRGGVKTKPLADWCQAQWEVFPTCFDSIFTSFKILFKVGFRPSSFAVSHS